MDPLVPHPPVDIATYIFIAFSRLYFTTNQPINFNYNQSGDALYSSYKRHSLQARKVLFQIFTLFYPFVTHNPVQQQMLESAYLYALQMIHTKFGTSPTTSPYIYPMA
jgi:hypothetical protein